MNICSFFPLNEENEDFALLYSVIKIHYHVWFILHLLIDDFYYDKKSATFVNGIVNGKNEDDSA
jgi:hypothetical protein